MSELKTVSATDIAHAVALDPQFRVPTFPAFVEGVVVIPIENGLVVEGSAERQVFRGYAALSLLPHLLPLLDGTRTLDRLAAELPDIPPEAIANAVSLLYTRGLLEEGGPAQAAPQSVPKEIITFFRRHVDVTRVNSSGLEAAVRLEQARLVVTGGERFGALLAKELGRMGLTNVTVGDFGSITPDTTLVVTLQAGTESRSHMAQVDSVCLKSKTPWLRSVCTTDWMEIGPLFEGDETCCYNCFAGGQDQFAGLLPPDSVRECQWISLVALEVVYLVSRICMASSLFGVMRFEFRNWSQTFSKPTVQPGCDRCCPVPGHLRQPTELAFALEQSVVLASKRRSNPKDHQIHYKVENIELQKVHKHYPSAPMVELPPPESLPLPETGYEDSIRQAFSAPEGPLDLVRLSTLLLRVGGLRAETGATFQRVQRWAPTGGNLGSVQLYVAARGVEGLQPRIYYYDPFEHGLVPLPSPAPQDSLDRIVNTALPPEMDPAFAALIILTGAIDKVTHKYGPFAYRVIHLDAGVAMAQLQASAGSLLLRCIPALRWNDVVLVKALNLDADHEPVTAVISVFSENT